MRALTRRPRSSPFASPHLISATHVSYHSALYNSTCTSAFLVLFVSLSLPCHCRASISFFHFLLSLPNQPGLLFILIFIQTLDIHLRSRSSTPWFPHLCCPIV
ncbi:hypothetical protein BJX62DRAFT_29433 [Aspergillus germanicus]